MAKPDDRSDNAEKLKEAVENTFENMEESEDYLAEHAEELNPEEAAQLRQKNANRKESIRGMREEMKDESDNA